MLTFAAPWWLSGLALLPVLRWLHRLGRHRRSLIVSHLALWRGAENTVPAGAQRQPPDPAWRRRALVVALLFVALAEPRMPASDHDLTIWIDDSLSMLTREAQGTRLDTALGAARASIEHRRFHDVQVRTLSHPWQTVGALNPDTANAIAVQARRNGIVDAPPRTLLLPEREHWLVTDGAHAGVLAWGDRRPDRIITTGQIDRNVGVEMVSARRSLQDPDLVDVEVTVTNGGVVAEERTLVVDAGGNEYRSSHRLEPGTSLRVRASTPTERRVHVAISPADALPEDDSIELDLSPLRKRIIVLESACPSALRMAIASHPALVVGAPGATAPDGQIECGGDSRQVTGTVPVLRIRADRMTEVAHGMPEWSSAIPRARRIALESPLKVGSRLEVHEHDTVLMSIAGDAVAVQRAGSAPLIETSVDFASADGARNPATPLLANMLIEQLLGVDLIDGVVAADRGELSARVVPTIPAAVSAREVPVQENRRFDEWIAYAVILGLVVLIRELIALVGQWRQLHGRRSMEAS